MKYIMAFDTRNNFVVFLLITHTDYVKVWGKRAMRAVKDVLPETSVQNVTI